MLLIECAVVSAVILATAVAMFVLFRYDPEGLANKAPIQRRAAEQAIRAELGKMGAFLSHISAHRSTRAAAATLAAVAFGLLEDATHEVIIGFQFHSALKAMADGFIVAACGGAMVWLILSAVARRHVHSSDYREERSSMNGQIRDALDEILGATMAAPPKEHDAVLHGVEQVEAVMRRLDPAFINVRASLPNSPVRNNFNARLVPSSQ